MKTIRAIIKTIIERNNVVVSEEDMDDAIKEIMASKSECEKCPFRKEFTYKAKYEKCIAVIKRFDPGIVGMYDL
jgi:hypothetical protein